MGKRRKQESPSSRRSRADPGLPHGEDSTNHPSQISDTPHIGDESPGEQRIVGELDAVVGHAVEGWAMNVQSPTEPATVEIFDGDLLLGSAVALMFRADLLAAGMGTGNHHFKFLLPESVFDGYLHIISVRPAGSTENLRNSPTHIKQSTADVIVKSPPIVEPDKIAVGMLEVVSEEGWVRGWAWYPNNPDRRVEVEILVDGEIVGETIAALHRPDLQAAGIGHGNYSFTFALPYEVLARPKESLISVRDKETNRILAEPRLFRHREIVNAINKLSELEDDARLLNSTLELQSERMNADKRAAAELFSTVGDFFARLAAATEAGKPPGSLISLRGAIEDITSRFPPIEFSNHTDPDLSICVEASGSLEAIYNTIHAIADFRSNIAIEVVLFDMGACDQSALLPLVVRNLRYLRLEEGHSSASARNEVAEFTQGKIIVFLAGYATPSANWLESVISAFDTNQSLAIIGAKIINSEGVLANAGVMLTNNRTELIGHGADPSASEFTHRRYIDSVTTEAFAVRREAWRLNCGLSNGHGTFEAALTDLCVRITEAGGGICYEPAFGVSLHG